MEWRVVFEAGNREEEAVGTFCVLAPVLGARLRRLCVGRDGFGAEPGFMRAGSRGR